MYPVSHTRMLVYVVNDRVSLEMAQKLQHYMFSQPQTSKSYGVETGSVTDVGAEKGPGRRQVGGCPAHSDVPTCLSGL